MESCNLWSRMFQRLSNLLLAVVCMTGLLSACNSPQPHHGLANNPWSVQVFGAKGGGYVSPVCNKLSYFSGAPLRFDFGRDLYHWKPGSFTYATDRKLIGKVDNRPIYQIIQDIQPIRDKAPAFRGKSLCSVSLPSVGLAGFA